MRTKSILVMALVLISATTFAQNNRFSVGAELGLPMGTYGDASSTGFGGSLRYEMPMGDKLGLTGTVGFLAFSGKEQTLFDLSFPGDTWKMTYKASSTNIPIMVGGKYYFSEQQDGFYLSLALGLVLNSSKTTFTTTITDPVTGNDVSTSSSGTGSASGFGWAPGLGYHLANVDIQLNWNAFTTTTTVANPLLGTSVSGTGSAAYLGLRLAYVFGDK